MSLNKVSYKHTLTKRIPHHTHSMKKCSSVSKKCLVVNAAVSASQIYGMLWKI